MKLFQRILCICLALLLLTATAAGCGETPGGPSEVSSETLTVTEGETVDEAAEALEAIDEVDYGGREFTVLHAEGTGFEEELIGMPDIADAVASGVINDAVFERNTEFELRCKLTYVKVPANNMSIMGMLTGEIAAGDTSYQFVDTNMSIAADCAVAGLLYNFLSFESIDYGRPWWDKGTFGFNLDGNVMFMNGAHNIMDDDMTYILAFNKEMIKDYQVENPYHTVQNGNWTLDYFSGVIQSVSADNGDGKWDLEDTYGFAASHIIGNSFFYGAGLQYIQTDPSTGEISLALDSGRLEKATNILDKTLLLVYDQNAIYMGNYLEFGNAAQLFIDEQALFFSENTNYLRSIASTMESDFGIVPIPKYDGQQENYHTWAHNVGSTFCLPANLKDTETIEKVLEIYVILSYRHVTPAYYDTLLGSRNVRDPESAEILADIFANRIYDMAQYYRTFNLADLFYNCVNNNQKNFVSSYERTARSFERNLGQIMKKLNAEK